MSALLLTPAQRKEHRAAAHHLDPVVMIGGEGLTPAVVKEVDRALSAHGLIKVRVFSDERSTREEMLAALTSQLSAAPVQHIGKLLVLWRPVPEKARTGRDERATAPRVVKIVKFAKSGSTRPQVKKVRVLGNERVTPGGNIKRVKKKRPTSVKKTVSD